MTAAPFAFLLLPLAVVLPYRRAGLTWPRAAALAVLAVALTAAGLAGTALYAYTVVIGATLCGHLPVIAKAVGVVAYLVVAAWASIVPRRVWAWLLAPASAVAPLLLVSYFFSGAHHYCET